MGYKGRDWSRLQDWLAVLLKNNGGRIALVEAAARYERHKGCAWATADSSVRHAVYASDRIVFAGPNGRRVIQWESAPEPTEQQLPPLGWRAEFTSTPRDRRKPIDRMYQTAIAKVETGLNLRQAEDPALPNFATAWALLKIWNLLDERLK